MEANKPYWESLDCRMFDFQDFYDDIAGKLPEKSTIAEIGLGAEGASACFLAEALKRRGKQAKFYWIDSMDYGQRFQMRRIMQTITEAQLGDMVELIPAASVEAACLFPDMHFEFVFIDASHKFEWTKAEILLWYRKIKHAWWLAGHDYNDEEGREVKLAVKEIIPKKRRVIHNTKDGLNVWSVQKDNRDLL